MLHFIGFIFILVLAILLIGLSLIAGFISRLFGGSKHGSGWRYIPPADNRMPAADSRHNLPQPVNCMNRVVATNGRKCSRTTKASTSILRKSRTEPVFGFETSFHLRLAGKNLFRLPVLVSPSLWRFLPFEVSCFHNQR